MGMTRWILAGAFALVATGANAQYAPSYGVGSNPNSHTNSGYTTSAGTYVQPHQQTNPNSTQRDNYSATGNVNPCSARNAATVSCGAGLYPISMMCYEGGSVLLVQNQTWGYSSGGTSTCTMAAIGPNHDSYSVYANCCRIPPGN